MTPKNEYNDNKTATTIPRTATYQFRLKGACADTLGLSRYVTHNLKETRLDTRLFKSRASLNDTAGTVIDMAGTVIKPNQAFGRGL